MIRSTLKVLTPLSQVSCSLLARASPNDDSCTEALSTLEMRNKTKQCFFLIINLLTCGNVVFTVGASVDVPVMQQELQETLKSWKIYINKIDNILSLLIEHIHHSLGRKPQQRMTDFQDTFYPISNSVHFCRAPAYMTKSRLIDWGNKNIPLQGEALDSNAKFPQLLNFVPHSLHPSETCQFACGGLAEKKTSPRPPVL